MGSLWKITTLAFDLPGGESYEDDNIDVSPPETENWTPTERKRKNNPLAFVPENDNSIKFFEKGLHQTVDRAESERNLTPYGKLSWQISVEPINFKDAKIGDFVVWKKPDEAFGYGEEGKFIVQAGDTGVITEFLSSNFHAYKIKFHKHFTRHSYIVFPHTVDAYKSEDFDKLIAQKLSWQIQTPKRGDEVFNTDTGELSKVVQVGKPMRLYYWAMNNLKNEFHHTIKDLIDEHLVSENEEYCITKSSRGSYYDILPLDQVEKHATQTLSCSQKVSWGPERNVWVTHWAIPGGQEMNPSDKQQDWTVIALYPDDDYKNAFKVVKERFKAYVAKNFPGSMTEGSDYMWANAYLWNVQSEKSNFLDKYLTVDEINDIKEDSILVIDKKDFPVQITNPIESL